MEIDLDEIEPEEKRKKGRRVYKKGFKRRYR